MTVSLINIGHLLEDYKNKWNKLTKEELPVVNLDVAILQRDVPNMVDKDIRLTGEIIDDLLQVVQKYGYPRKKNRKKVKAPKLPSFSYM